MNSIFFDFLLFELWKLWFQICFEFDIHDKKMGIYNSFANFGLFKQKWQKWQHWHNFENNVFLSFLICKNGFILNVGGSNFPNWEGQLKVIYIYIFYVKSIYLDL